MGRRIINRMEKRAEVEAFERRKDGVGDVLARKGGRLAGVGLSLVGRARYRALWRRALMEHTKPQKWPLQCRYLK